jgi:hypothetical protein
MAINPFLYPLGIHIYPLDPHPKGALECDHDGGQVGCIYICLYVYVYRQSYIPRTPLIHSSNTNTTLSCTPLMLSYHTNNTNSLSLSLPLSHTLSYTLHGIMNNSASMNREQNAQRHLGYVDMHYALKVRGRPCRYALCTEGERKAM